MSRKLAIKKLTGSDLTLFEWQFKNLHKGNQKSINLNANIFIDELYPLMPQIVSLKGGRAPLDLYIYGPGNYGLDNLQRKIIKGNSYKNWRLNGEFIFNPQGSPDRYNILEEGDFALFEFYGIEYPTAAKLLLVSQQLKEDASVHKVLSGIIGSKSMIVIQGNDIQAIVEDVKPNNDHPIHEFNLDGKLEEIVITGGDFENDRITSNPSLRSVSYADFEKAKRNAENIGQKGEEIVNEFFIDLKNKKELKEFVWRSKENPISPYDFEYIDNNNSIVYLDVKSTEGPFSNTIHISYNELLQMANVERYDLYRIYMASENKVSLRISTNLKKWAKTILEALNNLPKGIRSDGISLNPTLLDFEEEIQFTVN